MRRVFLVLLLLSLLLPAHSLADDPAFDWDWLLKQAAAGRKTATLQTDVVCDPDKPLIASEAGFTIECGGYGITGAVIGGGMVTIRNGNLLGLDALADEDGGAGLTVRGEGTIVVLSGSTKVAGGRGSLQGGTGGDGVRLEGDNQGLILRGTTVASGGFSRGTGGAGVRAAGCGVSVRLTDTASAQGGMGYYTGGAGIAARACTGVGVGGNATVGGNAGVFTGGHGIDSKPCDICARSGSVALSERCVVAGGTGAVAGCGVHMQRVAPGEDADLTLSGECIVFGGSGMTGGSAVRLIQGTLAFGEGEMSLFAGGYMYNPSPALALEGSKTLGEVSAAIQAEGAQLDADPGAETAYIVDRAMRVQNAREIPDEVVNGLNARKLQTKLGSLSVEGGVVSSVNLSGNSLRISMWNATYEQRLSFRQRLMTDGEDGARFILICERSHPFVTVDATVAALRKLQTLGVTQFAYTTAAPVYYERVLDLGALLDAVDASDQPVVRVWFGTADDAVIFIGEDESRNYQINLMDELRLELEPYFTEAQ